MKLKVWLLMLIFLTNITSVFSSVKNDLNISYTNQSYGNRNLLDVYFPEDVSGQKDVLVFIHGGSWNSGKKDTYWWLGRNFAKKNVVTVTINYSLSPAYQYEQMAGDCAAALKWVKNNISKYGGDASRIFVMGHSAGGHLASLIDSDPRFFNEQEIENPIRGVILNDGFGLDMNEYLLQAAKNEQTNSFLFTFTDQSQNWIKGSPFTYLDNMKNPYLILVGAKTYPAIKLQSKRLYESLSTLNVPVKYELIEKKRHIGMITQMLFKGNDVYKTILNFMNSI
ncbi:alpha/beta hydrolase [Daejeonella oryzae]|uniref:alpha/beta hydrolase n=1 Tax=Daejeonella oryzae TaxID=1122943 RepID=UPI00047B5A84|nr:alpha/beta hydrolase [Daejeonella oryzae]